MTMWSKSRTAARAVRLVAVFCLGEVLTMSGFALVPVLLPRFTAEWGLSATEGGWLGGVFFLGYVAAVPVLVAVTVSVKSASLLAGGVMVSPLSSAGVTVQLPLALAVPAESLAPVGTPAMVKDKLSEPSTSLRAEVILRPMGVSSSPLAARAHSPPRRAGWRWSRRFPGPGAAPACRAARPGH